MASELVPKAVEGCAPCGCVRAAIDSADEAGQRGEAPCSGLHQVLDRTAGRRQGRTACCSMWAWLYGHRRCGCPSALVSS
eukprot:15432035-Alexandrium_andersonii.AAC.1